jgi:hypothetical protein
MIQSENKPMVGSQSPLSDLGFAININPEKKQTKGISSSVSAKVLADTKKMANPRSVEDPSLIASQP